MSLESGTYVQDLQQSNPPGTDKKKQGDDHLRLIKTVLKNTFPNATRAQYFRRARNVTASGNIVATDMAALITADCTSGAITLTLPTLGVSDDGWFVVVVKTDASANAVTFSGTVNGASNPSTAVRYRVSTIMWTGTAWFMFQGFSPQALLQTADIATNAITNALMADDSVNTAEIVALAVTAAKIAADAVTTAKILDANVTNAKLAGPRTTVTTLLSGSGNYTRPAGCTAIKVRVQAGGGGGGAATTNAGSVGGDSSFNSVVATGGSGGGTAGGVGGTGGTGGSGSASFRVAGGDGANNTIAGGGSLQAGMNGGSSFSGGAGRGGLINNAGVAGKTNSGGGGGGGCQSNSIGCGGGGGEYFELWISSPGASLAYSVGAGGNGGSAGGQAGGNGGSGYIVIEEFY